MKRLIALFLLLPLVAFGQLMPIQRNFFTTNPAPVVTVAAGSNVTVQATTTFNTRTFTVNGQTDTNVVNLLATNVTQNTTIYGTNVSGAVSQASHATNADNATYVTTATITNRVYGTNVVGFVSEASHATNADYVTTATLTNQIYASNVVSGGQLPLGTVSANSGWNGAFLQYSNSTRVWGANGDQITNTSGYSLMSMADTNWVLGQVAQFGAFEYFGGPTNGFAVTNSGETVSRTNVFTCSISPFLNASTTTISSLVLNAYARHSISTNKFQRIAAGPVAIETYPFRSGGGGTVAGHYEFYAVDCVSNIMYELGSGPSFTISATSPTLITTSFVITNGFTATNLCYACVAFKMDSVGSGGPSLHWAHGGVYAAHLNFVRPISSATIDASQIVGTITNAIRSTNIVVGAPITNSVGGSFPVPTNAPAAGQIPVATSAGSAAWVPGWTNAVLWNDAGTHYMSNNANGIGVDGGAPSGKEFHVTGDINATGIMTAAGVGYNGELCAGAGYMIYWDARTRMYAPADGSFRITDRYASRDRLYLNGPVKALTDASAISIAQINVFTNSTIKSAFVGGVVDYTINCIDAEGGENQTLSGIVTFSACNTNGVFYNAVATEVAANQAKSVTGGTLTTSWALTPKTSYESTNILLQVTADTSLTPAANKFYILWQLRSNGTNSVTAL